MKSTWFGCRKRYDFARLVQESSKYGNDSFHNTFSNWLHLASLTLRQGVRMIERCGIRDEAIEAEYMKVVAGVERPAKLAEAMSVLVDALEAEPVDFLGKLLGEIGVLDKAFRGQCFTPTDVCRCMAKMVLCDLGSPEDLDHRLMIQEPAVGCGAMTIAAACELRERGFTNLDFYFVATDIDWRMARSAYIQFTLLDIPATVVHGNSLSLETFDSLRTLRAVLVEPFVAKRPSVDPGANPEPERPISRPPEREINLSAGKQLAFEF